jgi:hypothetical protein
MTPRQPDRDHLSRLTGANSRPGDGGHEIRDARTFQHFLNLFSHSRDKRILFFGLVLLCDLCVAFAYFAVKSFKSL